MVEEIRGKPSSKTDGPEDVVSDSEELQVKRWSIEGPLEQTRWKIRFFDGITSTEVESESFWAVVRLIYRAWKMRNRKLPKWFKGKVF